jgi:hypothetical protein
MATVQTPSLPPLTDPEYSVITDEVSGIVDRIAQLPLEPLIADVQAIRAAGFESALRRLAAGEFLQILERLQGIQRIIAASPVAGGTLVTKAARVVR